MKPGSNTTEGHTYQDIPGSKLPYHRGSSAYRGKRILEVLADHPTWKNPLLHKRVLDLGGNVGSVGNVLALAGASVTVVDYDLQAIAIGQEHYPDIHFESKDITLEYIKDLPHYDVVVWLSHFMWTAKQHGLDYALDCLWELSKKCDALVFETAGKDGSAPLGIDQEEVIHLLLKNTCFQDIRDTGPWAGGTHMEMGWPPRNVFVCTKPFLGSETPLSKVELLKRGEVKKTYKTDEVGSVALEILEREKSFLGIYAGTIAPSVLRSDANSITMQYVGPQVTFIPEADVQHILQFLRLHAITHRDIRPENLVWDGHQVYLIDYAWAVHQGEQTNYSHDVGGKYKCPQGFDDEYSLRKIQHDLWHV